MAVNTTHTRVRKAAVRLFAAKGYHGVGIRELADAAKLSSASLYHYMGTKEDLLADIMADCLDRLLSAAQEATNDTDDPQEKLGRLAALHTIAHAAHAKETAVVDNELRALSPRIRRRVVEQRDAYEQIWSDVLAEGQKQGVFLPDENGVTRRALLQMCSGVAHWYSPRGPLTLHDIGVHYAALVLRTVGASPAPAQPDMDRCRAIARSTWGIKI